MTWDMHALLRWQDWGTTALLCCLIRLREIFHGLLGVRAISQNYVTKSCS
jgi:succinate dehydrogenase hydrophobic anchor subunit